MTAEHLVDADAIVNICLTATKRNRGDTIFQVTLNERGVRVRLSSWPRAREALRALAANGYHVVEVDDAHPDWPELLVTGRAEQQTDEVYLEHGDVKPVTAWTELFPRLLVPTLVVSGDALEEVCVDRRMEATLQVAEAPHVSFVRIPGAGHCVRRDQPAAFYELVDDWLDDLSL